MRASGARFYTALATTVSIALPLQSAAEDLLSPDYLTIGAYDYAQGLTASGDAYAGGLALLSGQGWPTSSAGETARVVLDRATRFAGSTAAATGDTVRFALQDQGFAVSASRTRGGAAARQARWFDGGDLVEDLDTMSVNVDGHAGSDLGIAVRAGVVDADRAVLGGSALVDTGRHEHNTVVGGGMTVDALDERLTYDTEFAWSNVSESDRIGEARPFGPPTDDDDGSGGLAQSHRVDFAVVQQDGVSLSVYGSLSDTDSDYSAFYSDEEAGRTRRETGGSLSIGRGQLNLTDVIVVDRDDDEVGGTTRETSMGGSLVVNLNDLRLFGVGEGTGTSTAPFLPSEIRLGGGRSRLVGIDGSDTSVTDHSSGDQLEESKSLRGGLTWSWAGASTSLDLQTIDTRDRRAATFGDATHEQSIDLAHSFSGAAWWDATARFGVEWSESDMTDEATEEREVEMGFSFRLQPADLPDIEMGFDYSIGREYFQATGITSDSGTWKHRASLDFSKFLPIHDIFGPSLLLRYDGEIANSTSNTGLESSDLDYTIKLLMGVRF